ncbi:MAG TPA: tetratricopeptide repeat protein [Stellaceae bacterium]|jgi:predicted O-linked N-acetylglucosamine transferase (SPINDLY family)|nr:tetratricopeptide repeat protein [Stellaceae bacterium]
MNLVLQPDGVASPDDRLRAIVDHLNHDDAAKALELLTPLVSVAQPSLAARFVLAMTAWHIQRFDWALTLLTELHNDAPDNGGVAETLASLQAQLGQLEESLFTAKLATALGNDPAFATLVPTAFPGFDRAFLSIIERPLLGKAREAMQQGKLTQAIEFARQHVAIDPEHGEGRVFHAECLMRVGMAGAAVETLRPLADRIPGPVPEIASLYARALTAVGERKEASYWHENATNAAPGNTAFAAARIADAPFLGVDNREVGRLSREWLRRFALTAKSARKHSAGKKLVIGYLVSAFIDPNDAVAVAAVAQAHDRDRVSVLGFGRGIQTAEQNAQLTGAFSKWRDISALDPATLARTLSGDGVDVLVDAGGFASSSQLQALTRFDSGLRVSWLGNPSATLAPLYDVRLAASDYPILDDVAKSAAKGEGPVAFGADVTLAQLDARTVALWSAVLALVPEAKLVLRGRDMESPANIARLVAAFGENLAGRIDLRQAERVSEFYDAVDIALLPYHAASPRVAAEALARNVPAIAMSGEAFGSFMAGRGLAKRFVAVDGAQYCSLAMSLAASPQARILPPLERGVAKLAHMIEELGQSLNRRENAA